jgi:hypothetical protein
MVVLPGREPGAVVQRETRDAELVVENWLGIWPASSDSACTRTLSCNSVTGPILLVAASSPALGRLTFAIRDSQVVLVFHHEARAMAGDR